MTKWLYSITHFHKTETGADGDPVPAFQLPPGSIEFIAHRCPIMASTLQGAFVSAASKLPNSPTPGAYVISVWEENSS